MFDFMTTEVVSMNEVIKALSTIRIQIDTPEIEIHDQISEVLTAANIPFEKEYKLSSRNRIDFLIPGGIGIEVKRGKPNTKSVLNQLSRYAKHEIISELLFITERSIVIPSEICGKPCMTFNLNRLWGIAI